MNRINSHCGKLRALGCALLFEICAVSSSGGTAYFDTTSFLPAGSLDPTFNPVPLLSREGLPFVANTSLLLPDGKLLLTGVVPSNISFEINRLNPDGTLDPSFQSPAEPVTWESPQLQSDGRILILASDYGPLLRLMPDGPLDRAFQPQPRFEPTRFLVQRDQRILIGGWTAILSTNFLLDRLFPDGSADSEFSISLECPDNLEPPQFIEQPDAKIIIVGNFTRVNGSPRRKLVRLNQNGTLDNSFIPSDALLDSINMNTCPTAKHLALARDGRILTMAIPPDASPGAEPTIVILHPDGTLDRYADGFYNGGPLFEENDGKWLTLFIDPPAVIRRMNGDGSQGSFYSPLASTHTVALQPDGKILATGPGANGVSLFRLLTQSIDPPEISFRTMDRLSPDTISLFLNVPAQSVTMGSFFIESSPDLKNWSLLAEGDPGPAAQEAELWDTNATTPARFYRLGKR